MKFSKLSIKLSFAMIGIGLVLSVIGYSLGGKFQLENKLVHINSNKSEKQIKKTFSLYDFENINIDTNLDYIEIVKSDKNKLEVSYSENLKKVNQRVENHNLYITQEDLKGNGFVGLNFDFDSFSDDSSNTNNYMKLYVKDTSIINDIKIRGEYSDIALSGISIKNLDAQTSNGDVRISNFSVSNKTEIDQEYGDMNLSGVNFNEVSIRTSNGDINGNDLEVGRLDVENEYGDVSFKNINSKDLSIASSNGGINLRGNFAGTTDIESEYGDVSIKTTELKELYNYTVKSKYGDVSIDNEEFSGNTSSINGGKYNLNVSSSNGDVSLSFK